MISKIAWKNISWLEKVFFKRLDAHGGMLIAVEPFRPYLKRDWIKSLQPPTARQQLFTEIKAWAKSVGETPLTTTFRMENWKKGQEVQVARGGEEYSQSMWFLYQAQYNLYCLSTNRKTIEELALGAYVYNSKKIQHTEQTDKAAIADLRRLLRLSNMFLLAEWVQDMIERAIANRDEDFFRVVSNSIKYNVFASPSQSAVQWLLVILLWFLGGKNYPRYQDFLHNLHIYDILPRSINEFTFSSQMRKFGITKR